MHIQIRNSIFGIESRGFPKKVRSRGLQERVFLAGFQEGCREPLKCAVGLIYILYCMLVIIRIMKNKSTARDLGTVPYS